ncbi:MAG: heterodisulfide reductase-related iron-sulfur binding cluster [Chloroherpetonaceae bacterium]|nr:heterodisulfide reductase-related iron-sulfur binding cluster [Chthonomonadaceae bacterium]MDW8208916.1 heterodisulfide reductase-related iron-sulfur binding cluster [Chloroherpetonaceae bacterium]
MSVSHKLDDKTIKCIRCGFCLDACPTFRLTGQESKSPRGRIYLVRSWREGVIPFGPDVVEALDTCLGCRACETACPSGVAYGSILEMAREHIESAHLRPAAQTFARKQLLETLTHPGRLAFSLRAAGLLGRLTGGKMPGLAAQLLSGSPDQGIALPTPQGELKVHTLPERSPAKGDRRHTVGMLVGCVMRVLFGETNAATVRVLQENGCDVVAPPAAGCCGALHLHAGFHADALARMRALIDAFEPCLPELDAIVVNSAGCGSTLKEYGELLEDDPDYRDRARAFAAKVRDVSEWLVAIGLTPPARPVHAVVSYHDACHLAHGQRVRQQPRQLLQQIPGLQLVEMDEADTCCGSAGVYNITQPRMARQLLARKIAHLRETGARIVATGNPGCLAWIQQGVREAGMDVRICHPVELLDAAYRNS